MIPAGSAGPNPMPPPLAVTMGEPAGIGGEIALRAWLQRKAERLHPFFLIDDPERLAGIATDLDLPVAAIRIDSPDACAEAFGVGLPVLPLGTAVQADPSRPKPENTAAVLQSIRQAVTLTLSGAASAVVTNPIHKQVLMEAGFHHPGHTEYLAELCGSAEKPVMMLAGDALRVVPVTVHRPLAEVPASLSGALIVETGRTTALALRTRFGIDRPRLAVAGLNPHAGEGGQLGTEDAEIVAPAVAQLRGEGLDVAGPFAADSLFHPAARARYDAALCMYHDQALIPIKTIDFERAVNVTLGLPIIRTSPDHGTALDIAGRGKASATSLIAALAMAATMAARSHRSAGEPRSAARP